MPYGCSILAYMHTHTHIHTYIHTLHGMILGTPYKQTHTNIHTHIHAQEGLGQDAECRSTRSTYVACWYDFLVLNTYTHAYMQYDCWCSIQTCIHTYIHAQEGLGQDSECQPTRSTYVARWYDFLVLNTYTHTYIHAVRVLVLHTNIHTYIHRRGLAKIQNASPHAAHM
jgi:hypothetical protein